MEITKNIAYNANISILNTYDQRSKFNLHKKRHIKGVWKLFDDFLVKFGTIV